MRIQKIGNPLKSYLRSGGMILLALALSITMAAPAYTFQFEQGDVSGSFDTTLSYGLMWRVQDRDPRLIGTANGGEARSVNFDDGNLNYDKGLVSNVVKATSELGVNYRRTTGFFLRGTAFYDFENMRSSRDRILPDGSRAELTDQALDLVGKRARLLDAFVWGSFNLGSVPAQIRIGDQVVSWGESTFIQNGINVINPVDVSAIRLPGSELKEALIPEGMIWASVSPTMNTTFEGFYIYDWEATEIDPPGSYWSTNDFAGAGGSRVLLGFGAVPDTVPFSFNPPVGAVVPVGPSRDASDSGQYGLAYRLYAPWLNDTEFGLFFINYHSRLPIVSGRSGTAAAAAGVDPQGRTYAQTASVFMEYPEDIKLYGASFNTLIGGVALQGEGSYRRDVPLQIDDIELIFAALGAIDNLSPGNTPVAPLAAFGQLGLFPFEAEIPGYIRRDVVQLQATATNLFGPTFGANQFVLVGEVGYTHVRDMPDKDVLRLDGPGTPISGNKPLAGFHFDEIEPADRFADANSWGYRVAGRLDYNNAIGAITLSPRFAWAHDVKGTTPGPGGNFVEGRKAITVGLGADYQQRWGADLSYTNFFGAGRYNLINDRDIIAASVKYSF